MSTYYYLVAGLPDLTLEDSKLSYTVADFKTEFYPHLSPADKRLVDLFYLKHDNANVLKLLRDKDAHLDTCGNYSPDTLAEYIAATNCPKIAWLRCIMPTPCVARTASSPAGSSST